MTLRTSGSGRARSSSWVSRARGPPCSSSPSTRIPLLQSIDEQPFLQHALDDMLAEQVRYPEGLAALTQPQLERIRSAYWAKAARRVERAPGQHFREGQRLIDKNPLNVYRLPVIRRLFPNAKVIFAIRHPCDVILSCFMQHFRAPDFALLCKDIRHPVGRLSQDVRLLACAAGAAARGRARPAVRALRRWLRARGTARIRFSGAALGSGGPLSRGAGAGEAVHQHAELFAGGAADQRQSGRPLAQLPRTLHGEPAGGSSPISSGGAIPRSDAVA